LAEIRDRLRLGALEPSIPAHLELASIASTNFMENVGRKMIPFVDSIGLNEQELGHLYFALGGDKGRGVTSEDPDRIVR
jgi:ADP-dependent phosphofructokinase/glucokinase